MATSPHAHHGSLKTALAEHLVSAHGLNPSVLESLGGVTVLDGLHRGYHIEEAISHQPRPVTALTTVQLRFDTVRAAREYMEHIGEFRDTHPGADHIASAYILNDEWAWTWV